MVNLGGNIDLGSVGMVGAHRYFRKLGEPVKGNRIIGREHFTVVAEGGPAAGGLDAGENGFALGVTFDEGGRPEAGAEEPDDLNEADGGDAQKQVMEDGVLPAFAGEGGGGVGEQTNQEPSGKYRRQYEKQQKEEDGKGHEISVV